MPSNPKSTGVQFEVTSEAWEEHAAEVTFGKLTLTQYKSRVKPSLNARATIKELEQKLGAARIERDNADVVSNAVTLDVVNSIKGDPNFGQNSALYAALGYVRKDDRASGLKRNVVEPTTPVLKAA